MKQIPRAPKEGEHLHDWLLAMSRDLLVEGMSREDAISELLTATKNSERTTQDVRTEIENAVDGAIEWLEQNPGFRGKEGRGRRRKGSIWTDPMGFVGMDDPMARKDRRKARLSANSEIVEWIRKKEKRRYCLDKLNNGGFSFYKLYSGADFDVAVCKEMSKAIVRPLSKLELDLNCVKYSYIAPNPVWDGQGSRSDFNTFTRLFCVVEYDQQDYDYQMLAFNLLNRSSKFPLAMIVDSGGKSRHGWFPCFGASEYAIKTFCRQASETGADKTTWSHSQWVRMPNGFNFSKGKYQHVIWFSEKELLRQSRLIKGELL